MASQTLSYIGSFIFPVTTSVHKLGVEVLRILEKPFDTLIDIYEEEVWLYLEVSAILLKLILPRMSKLIGSHKCLLNLLSLIANFLMVIFSSAKIVCITKLKYISVCLTSMALTSKLILWTIEESREEGLTSQDHSLSRCLDVPSYLQMLYHRCIVNCIPMESLLVMWLYSGIILIYLARPDVSLSENRLVMRNDWTIPEVISCLCFFLRLPNTDRIHLYSKAYNEMAPNRNQQYSVLSNDTTLEHLIK